MLKCVFALIVLLHVCGGFRKNISLNNEIKDRLMKLEELHNNKKLNLTSDTLHYPTQLMHRNAASCVGVFARELKSLLRNVTIQEDSEETLEELKRNLEALKPHSEKDDKCPMKANRKILTPFRPYANFIRHLNLKKR